MVCNVSYVDVIYECHEGVHPIFPHVRVIDEHPKSL
jgi:hypothetical protein